MEQCNYGKITKIDDEVRVIQYGEGFSFDFIKESNGNAQITPQDNFIHSHTMSGEDLYIYKKEPFELRPGICHYQSDVYLLGKEIENQSCVGIRVTGGILAKLFIPNKLEMDMRQEDYRIKYHDDSVEHVFSANDKEIHLHIESIVSERQGISGKSLDNSITSMDITVSGGVGLDELIPLYNAVLKMCQFLTFRKNIAFDDIVLLKNEVHGDNRFLTGFAEMHVFNRFKTLTDKDWFRCISFENLGSSIVQLFKNIYEEKEKKPYFSLDFLPEDDADVNWITPDKIKKICTCLECEAALQKITADDDPSLKKLINDVLAIVETHEKSKDALPDKTYALIRGSISHWDLAAGDKIKALFHKYDQIMIQPACFKGSIRGFEEQIDKIVQFRNNTTHGKYMKVTGELTDTAANLMNLIYVSRLDRINMPMEMIKDKLCIGIVYR